MRRIVDSRYSPGFTVVELLIVIVVIGLLAAIVIVAYNGIQSNARDKGVLSDLTAVEKKINLYAAQNNDTFGSSVSWYSGSGANSNIQYSASSDNVIDVVAGSSSYCIRVYNTGSANYKTINTAATKGSTPTACTSLTPSLQATGIIYSQAFDTNLDGWSGTGLITYNTTYFYSSPAAVCVTRPSGGGGFYVEKVVTGLTIGAPYTLSGQVMRTGVNALAPKFQIEELGGSTNVPTATNTWLPVSQSFTATATTHTIRLTANFQGSVQLCADNVLLVPN